MREVDKREFEHGIFKKTWKHIFICSGAVIRFLSKSRTVAAEESKSYCFRGFRFISVILSKTVWKGRKFDVRIHVSNNRRKVELFIYF